MKTQCRNTLNTNFVFVKANVAPADEEKREMEPFHQKTYITFKTSKKWKNEIKSLDKFNFNVSKAKWLREILNLCSEGPDYKPAATKILNKFTQLRDFMFFFAVKKLVQLHKEKVHVTLD